MSGPITDLTLPPLAAGTTPVYTSVLRQANGSVVPASALTSLTLTLADTGSGAVVNAVSDVNILNTGRGTVDANGVCTVTLTALDTAIVNPVHAMERRSMILRWSFGGGALTGAHQVDFLIRALVAS